MVVMTSCDPQDTTRERLLDTAERLFAEHGYQATTMRTVTAGATANIAAVNYHFGSKQALLAAVVHRALGPVVEERRRRLDALDAAGDPSVEAIVDAIIGPMIERVGAEPSTALVLRLVGRLLVDPDPEMRALIKNEVSEAERRQLGLLERALPALPREELWLRMRSMFAVVGAHLTGAFDVPAACLPLDGDRDALRARLVTFLAAGLRAPATAPCGPGGPQVQTCV
jgi:AcrR family transcriptional regulator